MSHWWQRRCKCLFITLNVHCFNVIYLLIIALSFQLLHVVNGHDGSLLWHLEEQLERQISEVPLDVYSAQYIPDIDDDGFVDVISAHTVSDISGTRVVKSRLILSDPIVLID